eukprot:GEZU01015918.1.p1 GENE.GEZU01015918.1~~GEZU01015918.1.p1  ORF type:complete len:639 (-),score=170.14 GEZU01015918.1:78-1994(-)
MKHLLYHPDYLDLRKRIYELLTTDPIFTYKYDLSLSEERDLARERAKRIIQAGFIHVEDIKNDPYKVFTFFETLATWDGASSTKIGIQFNLFGASILFLGTEEHHKKYLKDVSELKYFGCFCLTELSHGSNAQGIQTIATYIKETGEFDIFTPCEEAQKFWIGNSAIDAKYGTVFANLIVDGVNHGVHGFIVQLRDDAGNLMKGVRILDVGHKFGLNGLDNGRIWFDHVRIPRQNLLDRFAKVNEKGQYQSCVAHPGKRFFTHLGALLVGRIGTSTACISGMKLALTIALRYASTRKQFGPAGHTEMPILNYLSLQRRLFPYLAYVYGSVFATDYLKERYISMSEKDEQEVHALAAALKADTTWALSQAVQHCRECCGGLGFATENRLGIIKTESEASISFEGDNVVLQQLVAKVLLSELKRQFKNKGRMQSAIEYKLKQIKSSVQINLVASRNASTDHIQDLVGFILKALEFREWTLLYRLALTFQKKVKSQESSLKQKQRPISKEQRAKNSFEAWNQSLDQVLALATAFTDRVVMQQFVARINSDKVRSGSTRSILKKLAAMYGLCKIEKDPFFVKEYISSAQHDAVTRQINKLCGEIRPHVRALLDAFDIPESIIGAPIAGDWVSMYSYNSNNNQ